MNPQNIAQHIQLRHSSLWRKSMWSSQDVERIQTCHKQLNEMGQTGKCWTSRDNFIKTNFSHLGRSSLPKMQRSKLLSQTLYHEKKQTASTKSFIEQLQKQADTLEKNKKLVQGMSKLRQMNILSAKQFNRVQFPGIIRHAHVYNDYHDRIANPGYSRNYQGKFYTK